MHAFSDDALGNMDATDIVEAIRSKKVSVEEVTEAAIQRTEKVNPEINAIVIKTYDSARKKSNANPKGLFFGIPAFIKDTDHIKGLPTQMGTMAYKAKAAKKNSRFAEQLFSTGLNILGKSTLTEFGLICSAENAKWGITRNPWNTDYSSGGSSSGSAALVASGAVPIASANDGAGSIRIPASFCGLVGLKPTRNRLHNIESSSLLPLNLVCQGVLTRSVRDTAAFFSEAEKFFRNPKLPSLGMVKEPGKKRLKIAFFENVSKDTLGHQDADTVRTLEESATLLSSLGHKVERLAFPFKVDEISYHFLNYYGMLAYTMSHWGRLVMNAKVDKNELEPFTMGLSDTFKKNIWKTSESLRVLRQKGIDSEKYFEQYDLLMTPVLAHKLPKIGHFSTDLTYDEIRDRAVGFAPFTGLQNVSGAPAISLPLGKCSDDMPLGIQFVAPAGQEQRLLELAYELEKAKPWRTIY